MRFWVLLGVFVIVAAGQAFVFPPMEGSDEPLHFAYVEHLRAGWQLPQRTTYLENCTRQQSGQPPLVYGLAAGVLELAGAPRAGCDAVFDYYFGQTDNRWLLTPNPYRRDDNNTNFLPVTSIPPPDGLPTSLYIARLISVAFGAVSVVGAYLAAGEVFRRETWRLTAAALFAFTPTLLHVSAYFTNDSAAAGFTTLVMWRALHLMNRGVTVRRLLVIGALAGVGALAKVSVALALPAVAVAVMLTEWRRVPGGVAWRSAGEMNLAPTSTSAMMAFVRRVIGAGVWIALPLVLTVGVWAGWGWLAYGDPLGTGTHVHETLNYDPPLDWLTTLRGLPDVYLTYVGLLGYANVYLHPAVYAALTGVMALAGVGVVWRMAARRVGGGWIAPAVMMGVLWLTLFVGFLRWYRTIFDVTGRLMLPAHIAFALALTAGLALLPRGRWVRLFAVGTFAAAGLIATFMSLHAAYAPRFVAELPALRGASYTFDDTVRLLGYAHEGDIIAPDVDTVTLCWEVLQPTDRLAAYAVRYVKDGVAVANRTTVHGLGKYNSTLWQPGAVFCDAVDMPVGDALFGAVPPEPGATYDILVVMLDVRTLDVNWTAHTPDGTPVQFPVLGQLRAPE